MTSRFRRLLAAAALSGSFLAPGEGVAAARSDIERFVERHAPAPPGTPAEPGPGQPKPAWALLDMDGEGAEDDLAVYYTDGAAGEVRLYRNTITGYSLRWQWPANKTQEPLRAGAPVRLEAVDLDFDGRPEILLRSAAERGAECTYILRQDRGRWAFLSPDPEAEKPQAFCGHSLALRDLDRDGDLDAVLTQNQPAAPSAAAAPPAEAKLYVYAAGAFQWVETRRVGGEDSGDKGLGYFLRFREGEVSPGSLRRELFLDSPYISQKIRFLVTGLESEASPSTPVPWGMDEVDCRSFRANDQVRPLKCALTQPDYRGKRWLSVTFRLSDLRPLAHDFWREAGGKSQDRACFTLSAKIEGQPVLVDRRECLKVW